MKYLILLLSLILSLLFAGCNSSNSIYPESEFDGELKSAPLKMVPIKGEIQSHVSESLDGIPVFGTLSGNVSHLGKLVADESTWYTISVEMDEQTWTIKWEMFGAVCAANGDLLKYTLYGSFSIPDNKLSGHIDFNGGTGRFGQAEGSAEFTGYADDPMNITSMYMHMEGMITNVGSSHGPENELVQENEAIAETFITAWDIHDANMLSSLFADEFAYIEVTSGRVYNDKMALAMYAESTLSGLPDSRFEVVTVVANEKYAAVVWIWKATNTVGWPYMGIPATDKYFEMLGASVMEIENGKIIWNKDYWDWNTFMQMIGVVP